MFWKKGLWPPAPVPAFNLQPCVSSPEARLLLMPKDRDLAARRAQPSLLSFRRVLQPLPPQQPFLLLQYAGSATLPTAQGLSVDCTAGLPGARRRPEALGLRGEGGHEGAARAEVAPYAGVPAASCQQAPARPAAPPFSLTSRWKVRPAGRVGGGPLRRRPRQEQLGQGGCAGASEKAAAEEVLLPQPAGVPP